MTLALSAVDRMVSSLEETGSLDVSPAVVERVQLKPSGMLITLNLRAVLPLEQIPNVGANVSVTRLVQMRMKRRGVETRLVIPEEEIKPSRIDPALLRALARGHQWFSELGSGTAISTKQIAVREGLSHSYVRHTVPLGLIAPSAVEAICAGHQPAALSAERLKDQARLPLEWMRSASSSPTSHIDSKRWPVRTSRVVELKI